MMTITDTEAKQKGGHIRSIGLKWMQERFITLLNREPFDYTTWQRTISMK